MSRDKRLHRPQSVGKLARCAKQDRLESHLHDHLVPVLDLLTWRRTRSQLHFGNLHRPRLGTLLGFVALNHQLIPHLSAALENAVRGKLQHAFRAKIRPPAAPPVAVPNVQAQDPQADVVLGAEPAAARGAGAVPRKPLAASGLLDAHRGARAARHIPAAAHRLVARSAAEPSQAAVVSRAERQPKAVPNDLSHSGGRVACAGLVSL